MDLVIGFGSEVKATGNRVSGYLVRFGTPDQTDLDGEFFTPDTDFGRPVKSGETFDLNLYWHHGLDPVVGRRQIGEGKVKADDVGLWYEGIIAESDDYLRRIQRLAGKGRLGFSSGAAAHLVEKEAVPGTKSTAITRWPLGEASLTHCPAEPTNTAATKSAAEYVADLESLPDEPEPDTEPTPVKAERPDSITTFERRLREAFGYSRREAKAIASHGYKALRDAASDETDTTPDQDRAAAKADLRRLLARQQIAAQAVEAS